MLPPGHLAGGYLVTLGLIEIVHPELAAHQINQLLLLGTLAGFVPDLDHFITFAQARTFQIPENERNHRNLFTHTPIFWLMISAIVYLLTKNGSFGPYLALTIWVGSWSHFFLDTFIHGVKWLWPFSRQKIAFWDLNIKPSLNEPRFLPYWWKFTKWYTQFTCFYLEILLIILALFIFIYH